ncbi:unnamed protein product, partial [Owenia fusiformis]
FSCGHLNLEYATQYKYLGLKLNEHMDMTKSATILAKSGSRALGAIMAKSRANGGLSYEVYTHLFDCLVAPVLHYSAGVWGTNKTVGAAATIVQNKARRFYLGVGQHASNIATQGDMCWVSVNTKQKVEATRLWCRLKNMSEHRITKKIHLWALTQHNSWEYKMQRLLRENNKPNLITDGEISGVRSILQSRPSY